jgi:hypothetical protein
MDRKFMLLLLIKMDHYGHIVVQFVEMFVFLLFYSELVEICEEGELFIYDYFPSRGKAAKA